MRSNEAATLAGITVDLVPPPGWFDKTMLVYSAPIAPGEPMAANMVVSRDALATGENFAAYCDRQIKAFEGGLPGYSLFGRQDGDFGGRWAMRLDLEWMSAAGPLRQMVVFINAGRGVVVSFAGSAASDQFEGYRALFTDHLERLIIAPAPGQPA
jgi:hypothetical protein